MNKITVLTPAYNREKFLMRMYNSMIQQTNYSFQWLIIDDGSNDKTEQTVHTIIKNHKYSFQVDYFKKENGGKHTALNYSHPYIKGEYVMVLDSDDYLKKEAIEIINKRINELEEKNRIGWLAFLKGNKDGAPFDSLYKEDGEITTYENYMNKGRKGECCDVYLTKAFISYPYPEFSNEKFISENYLNIQASLYGKYKMITYNDVIQIVEYLDGGLTLEGRALQIKNPKGHAELWKHVTGELFNLKQNVKGAWLYIAYSFFAGVSVSKIINESLNKKVTFFNLPFGYGIFLFWKKKYLKRKMAG